MSWEHAPVLVRAEDVRTSISALGRWADECEPGADEYLRGVISHLKAALVAQDRGDAQ